MFLRKPISTFTGGCSEQIEKLKRETETADAIVIGAGAGMSAAAGFSYDGERFEEHFADFHQKYGIRDMYSGGFYPYDTLEEYWAWWSRHIMLNRYEAGVGKPYSDLLELVKGKEYFVLTTNVDHQFQLAGFDKKRLFYTQGDYGLWQCSRPCHQKTYDNEERIRQMEAEQKDMKIPTELIPRCPVCGGSMQVHMETDRNFIPDMESRKRLEIFLERYHGKKLVILELGIGWRNQLIKAPLMRLAAQEPQAVYVTINLGEIFIPDEIREKSYGLDGDLTEILHDLAAYSGVHL